MMFYKGLLLVFLVPVLHSHAVGGTKIPVVHKKTVIVVSVKTPEALTTAVDYTSQQPIQTSPPISSASASVIAQTVVQPPQNVQPVVQSSLTTPPTVNSIEPIATNPPTTQQPFACGTADKQLSIYETDFVAKPALKQTQEWTQYQGLEVAYQQNCEA